MGPAETPPAAGSADVPWGRVLVADVPRRKVGLSDAAVAADESTLVTSGLGSCLGVALYDPTAGAGGLLHAMLPESHGRPGVEEKFVVDGVDALVEQLAHVGASPDDLRAKLAGAAEMLQFEADEDRKSVGCQNVAAAERVLARHDIPVEATDTGGNRGRSLQFETAEGRLHVVYAGGDAVVL